MSQKFVDGFEDGDHTSNPEWYIGDDDGGTVQTTQDDVYEGDYSLEISGGSDTTVVNHDRGVGSPSDGITWTAWLKSKDGNRAYFGITDEEGEAQYSENGISVGLEDISTFVVRTGDSDGSSVEGDTFGSYDNDTWYRFEVTLNPGSGDIDIEIYDESDSLVDSTNADYSGATEHRYVFLSSGGDSGSGGSADTRFDNVTYDVQTDPEVVSNEATNITNDSTHLNGEVTDLGGETEVDAYFEYRETGASTWNTTTAQNISSSQTFNDTISGLDESTEYEFRAVIDDTGGTRLDEGSTLTYTTESDGEVSSEPASDVSSSSAQLNGDITDLKVDSVEGFFRYRETGATEWSETSKKTLTATGPYDETITELSESTEYEFEAVIEDDEGIEIDSGTTETFTTDTKTDPSVQTDPASNISDDSAQLNAEITDMGDYDSVEASFQYRQIGAGTWNQTTTQTITSAQVYDETVTGLDPETEYEFRALVEDDESNTLDTGDTLNFTTEEEPDDTDIQNRQSPLDGSEYLSKNVEHRFDVEFNEPGDYYVDIKVDGELKFQDEVNDASEGQVNNYDEVIDTGDFDAKTTEIDVYKQSDGDA